MVSLVTINQRAVLYKSLTDFNEYERCHILSIMEKDEIVQVRHQLYIIPYAFRHKCGNFKGKNIYETPVKLENLHEALNLQHVQQLHANLRRLRSELQTARHKGALKSTSSDSRACARCRAELGRIINRGAFCRWCRHRVCKSCREYLSNETSDWLCTVCHKQMELTAATGDWMSQFVRCSGKAVQRSWTFSDTTSSPWAALRNSPEMRAYSSMPRHQDCDFVARMTFCNQLTQDKIDPNENNEPVQAADEQSLDVKNEHTTAAENKIETIDNSSLDKSEVLNVENIIPSTETIVDENIASVQMTDNESNIESPPIETRRLSESISYGSSLVSAEDRPLVNKRAVNDTILEPLTGTVFRKMTLKKRRVDTRNLPPAGDDASVCSESVSLRAVEDDDRIHTIRTSSLGARSDSLASVYSGAGEGRYGSVAVRGEVEFGLQYNYRQGALEIYVKQCRDLAAVDTKRNRSDPYVKVYLLPDKSKSGKRKTRVKKHTLNPIFEETLKFYISLEGLESRTLWLSVWHSDMFGRNDFLGEVTLPLQNKVFDDPLPKFYSLQERTEPLEELLSSKGELIVGLKFVPPESNPGKKSSNKGCLQVLVKEAKNLAAVKSNGTSDPFCKSYLLPDKGRSSKQKTLVVRKCVSPAWNHTFKYNGVTLDELSSRSLELTIWDHDRLASNEFLGGVRLNTGSGKHNGKPVDWMDASGKENTLWQRMLERPNLWVESCLSLRPSLDLRNNS